MTWERGHVFNHDSVMVFYQSCLDARDRVLFDNVEQRTVSHWRPIPLSTIELTKKCSTHFRIGAATTLKYAEELY